LRPASSSKLKRRNLKEKGEFLREIRPFCLSLKKLWREQNKFCYDANACSGVPLGVLSSSNLTSKRFLVVPMSSEILTNSGSINLPAHVQQVSHSLLLAAFETSPDALFLFNSERVLVHANAAAFALEPGEESQIGKQCCHMLWQIAGETFCVVDRAIEAGERIEVEMQSQSQSSRPLSIIVQPLKATEDAQPEAVVIVRDISDLRKAEAEAIAQRSFMASIADLTPAEIYALDKNGRITWMNRRAEADDLLMLPGRLFLESIAEESHRTMIEQLRRAAEGLESEVELKAVRTDETVRDVEINTAPLWKDGEVAGVLAFVRDVTERKRAQELLVQSDKLRAVGELAAGVAHNLNNSLTVIQGRAQLLLMRATDEHSTKSLTVITKAVEEGARTLRRILEFSRRDEEKDFQAVELGELITSSIEIARPKWQRKSSQGEIDVRIECNEHVYVLGDLAELREVVLNLIFNAVDAMTNGGIMEVGTRAELENGCFWVADTGPGMSAETVSQIFEPFFTTKGKLGTGLGLSASHGIVTRHQGEIMVVSEPGEGTRFEVRLPICEKRSTLDDEPGLLEEVGSVI
jgi:PAS domain S-box-containing protein